ncbi:MAG: S1/P1 nuclease [Flavobacteriaceae bacterium]
MFSYMDWGRTGHQVVGALAQQYLTPKAQKEVDGLLDGVSLVSISNYGDEIKSNPKYKAFRPWHYINLPLDESYANAKKNPKGDVVMAIKKCIVKVKDREAPKSERAFYLKLLVHFIGDLHQPMHVGRKEDRGGNDIRLRWLGRSSNLHRLWDSHLIDSHGMNAAQLLGDLEELSPKLIKEIQNQSLEQWVNESQALAKIIYENTPSNSKLGEEYQSRYMPLLKIQLQRGGLRLAGQLNEIFK